MLKKENIKIASSTSYFENILEYIKKKKLESFLDVGCGIGNKLGRYIQENFNTQVFVNDEREIEALGECLFISFEELKRKPRTFDIIHASCLFHEVCALDDFEQREIKGGPHTLESLMLAELFFDLLKEKGTLIIEDFVACSYDEFLQHHYFLKTLKKDKELFDRLHVSLIVVPNLKSAQEDMKYAKQEQYTDLVKRIFFDNKPLQKGEFKKFDEFGKVLVYLKRYRDHHMHHDKNVYEKLFLKAGFKIEKTQQDTPLTMQWFLKKS